MKKIIKYSGEYKNVNWEINEREAESYHKEMGHNKTWT